MLKMIWALFLYEMCFLAKLFYLHEVIWASVSLFTSFGDDSPKASSPKLALTNFLQIHNISNYIVFVSTSTCKAYLNNLPPRQKMQA